MDFKKVRKWSVEFTIHQALDSMPIPEMVVEEEQKSRSYSMDGRFRSYGGGQMVLTIGGEGRLRIGDKVEVLRAGRAFLHNHNDAKICYFYPPNGQEEWKFLWFSFYNDIASQCVAEINQKYGYIFDVPIPGELYNRLKSFSNYGKELQVLTPLEGAKFFYENLALLCTGSEREIRASSPSVTVEEVQQLIINNPIRPNIITFLATEMKISREHLSRLFHEQIGLTLQDYIMRIRLRMAIDLLHQTRLSLKEIAVQCGWQNYANFYHTFSRKLGVSPTKLREQGLRPQI